MYTPSHIHVDVMSMSCYEWYATTDIPWMICYDWCTNHLQCYPSESSMIVESYVLDQLRSPASESSCGVHAAESSGGVLWWSPVDESSGGVQRPNPAAESQWPNPAGVTAADSGVMRWGVVRWCVCGGVCGFEWSSPSFIFAFVQFRLHPSLPSCVFTFVRLYLCQSSPSWDFTLFHLQSHPSSPLYLFFGFAQVSLQIGSQNLEHLRNSCVNKMEMMTKCIIHPTYTLMWCRWCAMNDVLWMMCYEW
jgi:hypothetical protein